MAEAPLRPDLSGLRRRLAELEGLMADPATFGDSRRAAALGAELRFTGKAVKADDLLTNLEKELAEAQALAGEADPEMRRMADEEVRRLTPLIEVARDLLIKAIVPPNPDDSRNAMMEIRAGTGGEEASLFASELLRARLRAAGAAPSPLIDRTYFRSVYFREPGGILLEIATDGPGFLVDETLAALGTGLMLPPAFASARAEILAALPSLDD